MSALKGSNVFLLSFKVDPFTEGDWYAGRKTGSTSCKNGRRSTTSVQSLNYFSTFPFYLEIIINIQGVQNMRKWEKDAEASMQIVEAHVLQADFSGSFEG